MEAVFPGHSPSIKIRGRTADNFQMQIVLYSTEWCDFSSMVRRELTRSGAAFAEVVGPADHAAMLELAPHAGELSLPVLVVGDTAYTGSSALAIARELARHRGAAAA